MTTTLEEPAVRGLPQYLYDKVNADKHVIRVCSSKEEPSISYIAYMPKISLNTMYTSILSKNVDVYSSLATVLNATPGHRAIWINVLEALRQLKTHTHVVSASSYGTTSYGCGALDNNIAITTLLVSLLPKTPLGEVDYTDPLTDGFIRSTMPMLIDRSIAHLLEVALQGLSTAMASEKVSGQLNEQHKKQYVLAGLNAIDQYNSIILEHKPDLPPIEFRISTLSECTKALNVAADLSSYATKLHSHVVKAYDFSVLSKYLSNPFTTNFERLVFSYFSNLITSERMHQ